MWDWGHFNRENWWNHTQRSLKLGILLLLSGGGLLLHALIPFWQQPKKLQACEVARAICEELDKRKHRNLKM